MTNDALALMFQEALAELHAKIDALPDSPQKRKLNRRARIAHAALEDIAEDAVGGGMIQPLSGGDPKPPGGP